jgi:site-specific DNA-cytosine methylase
LKVLDLFCGLGGWSQPFFDNGHECTGIDINKFPKDHYPGRFIQADLFDYEPKEKYDIVLASPPCNEFSIAKKFGHGTQDERIGLDLVYRCWYLIDKIKPKYWIIENVRGLQDFLPKANEIVKYNRHKDGKVAYLWTNIGKLGLVDCMINKKIDINKDSKASRAKIPYPLAKLVYDWVWEHECLP